MFSFAVQFKGCFCSLPQVLMRGDDSCFASLLNTDIAWWVQAIFKQLPPQILYIPLVALVRLMIWVILNF